MRNEKKTNYYHFHAVCRQCNKTDFVQLKLFSISVVLETITCEVAYILIIIIDFRFLFCIFGILRPIYYILFETKPCRIHSLVLKLDIKFYCVSIELQSAKNQTVFHTHNNNRTIGTFIVFVLKVRYYLIYE